MSQTYTDAIVIGTAGTSAGCMALHNSTTSPITAVVVPWRNNLTGLTLTVAIPAGGILPLKVREVKSTTAGLVGLN